MHVSKYWRIRTHDQQLIRQMEREARVPSVLAQLLVARGVADGSQARTFLDAKLADLPDPGNFPGIAKALPVLMDAIRGQQPIAIYGDYDVDGTTGTAILWQCLRLLGARVDYYVPHRLQEGYGLHIEALETLAERGHRLVVTVDCGITAVQEAARAAELGLRLVITDHHTPGPQLPMAAAIVHPKADPQLPQDSPVCGAGVAFKLAWALCREFEGTPKVSERLRNFLLQSMALAALGTVADVVPLRDENRILVRHGLVGLKSRPGVGLAALLKISGLQDKPRLQSEDIAFALAPRINAAGRLGQATLAVELLVTHSPERAEALATYINELNESRQTLERSIYLAANKQALAQLEARDARALVLADRGWHAGVIGIVAGRIAEKFHRPTILIALDESGLRPAVGSARSVPGCNLVRAMADCASHLVTYGGHAQAAGLKILEQHLDAFREEFNEVVTTDHKPATDVPELWIDAEAPLGALTLQTVEQMEQLAPFGEGNRRPVLCATDVHLVETPKRIGGGGRHLAVTFQQHGAKMRGVAFGQGDWLETLEQHQGPVEIAFQPVINDFQGRRKVEMHLSDWRAPTTGQG